MNLFGIRGWSIFLLATATLLRAQSTVPTLAQAVPAQTIARGTGNVTLDLRNYFAVPGITGQVAQFDTVRGKFNVELLATDAPLTVANFLTYVNRGAYTNTFIHRSVPGFVIQGGGFTLSGNSINAIPSDAPVQNEFRVPNTRGTLAMAKTDAGPNTATNQWFVNLADNRANLDSQNGGFTVFARVLGTGMSVADSIAAVPVFDASSSLGGVFTALPLLSNALTAQTLILIRSIKVVPLFPATSGGDAVANFSAASSDPAIASVSVSGSNLVVTAVGSGTAVITARATDVNANVATATFNVTSQVGSLPAVSSQPVSRTVAPGGTADFSVTAVDPNPLTYQWTQNGAAIPGATADRLTLTSLTSAASGDYAVRISNSFGTITSAVARLIVATPEPGRLANLSVRSVAGLNGQPLIVGFFVAGGTRSVLIRGIGPALAAFGITDAVADSTLTLYDGSTLLVENDDWGTADNAAALPALFTSVGAFALPGGSKDAVLAVNVSGSRTAQINGKTAGGGVALVELYDTGTGNTPRLTNVSARNFVGTGDNVLIAGFVINGNVPKKLLVRAVGPTLADFGVSGTLVDPKLEIFEIFDGRSALVAVTDNWGEEPNAGEIAAVAGAVGAFALKSGGKDAAFVITLPAGVYSAKVSGVGNTTGDALIEIYEVP